MVWLHTKAVRIVKSLQQTSNLIFLSHQVLIISYNFTPFSFLFFLVYSLLLLCLVSLQDFFSIWILIELLMLVFLGISYTVLSSRFSCVMQYFLIQTLASFSIFVFYFLSFPSFYTLSFILKLAMFPCYSWFISVINRFPNSLFLLARTLHKLPPFFLILITLPFLSLDLLILSSVLSLLVAGLVILVVSDIRLLLVVSSIGNNSWLLLSMLQGIHLFSLFFILYSFSLCLVIRFFRSSSLILQAPSSLVSLSLLSLSGFPPFPLFFVKAYLISLSFSSSYFLLLFLLFAALVLVGYIRSLFHFATFHFATFQTFLLVWWVSLYKTLVFKTKQTLLRVPFVLCFYYVD